jgi:predicted transcriptional regulator
MPKLARQHPNVITVKLAAAHLTKLDSMAARLNRSRADMVRAMIDAAAFTGQPDILVAGVAQQPAQDERDGVVNNGVLHKQERP